MLVHISENRSKIQLFLQFIFNAIKLIYHYRVLLKEGSLKNPEIKSNLIIQIANSYDILLQVIIKYWSAISA
jgi:hypothetical protein